MSHDCPYVAEIAVLHGMPAKVDELDKKLDALALSHNTVSLKLDGVLEFIDDERKRRDERTRANRSWRMGIASGVILIVAGAVISRLAPAASAHSAPQAASSARP